VSSVELIGRSAAIATGVATLTIDLGGTRLKAGIVVDSEIQCLEVCESGADALSTLRRTAQALMSNDHCERIGLAVPGIVEEGVARSLPGKLPGLDGQDLAAWCQNHLGRPAVVVNDAFAAGIGEAGWGAGRGISRVVVVTVGTGIGVCALVNGVPTGEGPLAGGTLSGHIPIAETSEHTDNVGNRGSIEALCCAQRIVDYAGPAYATVPDVYAGNRRGESMARQGLARYRRWLVRALVALAHAHGPEMIVLGGGPMTAPTPLLDSLEADVNARLFPGMTVKVRATELHESAALIGLAAVASRGLR